MKKELILIFSVLVIAVLGYFIQSSNERIANPDLNLSTDKITYTNATEDLIVVDLPFPGAVVGKDFSVLGMARGVWFFEGSFPIDVLDEDGKILFQTYATAEGEWMTKDFVPFKSKPMKIPENYIGPATLVLKKDNASGLPEHDASISFPINIEY